MIRLKNADTMISTSLFIDKLGWLRMDTYLEITS